MVYVDYPGEMSLKQIYGTFNRAMLRLVPSLKPYSDPLTNAMVEFYIMSQVRGWDGTSVSCLLYMWHVFTGLDALPSIALVAGLA